MKLYKAPRIYTGDGNYHDEAVLVLNDQNEVVDIISREEVDLASVQEVNGVLVPGFVNAHCHLELSHMKGKLPTGTGLLSFIGNVVKQRAADESEIQEAIYAADKEMYEKGIVAVGDICNVMDTVKCKAESKLRYYNFVEIFDFLHPELTDQSIQQYSAPKSYLEKSAKDKTTIVPHAPYSVSKELLSYISAETEMTDTISIHNQETPAENELFLHGTGEFNAFYKGFDISLEHFEPTRKTSIHYILEQLAHNRKMLFVHNTLTTREDINAAHQVSSDCYWASCPNANLYIENRLPDYQAFIDAKAKVCLGTDSLTSNWQLDILEEIKIIKRYNSYINFNTLISWACINGANALGFDDLGSFTKNKKPGVVLIENAVIKPDGDLDVKAASSKRIV
jgi:cytosine/adenosine deaminase-related metal-dependent hydrolase